MTVLMTGIDISWLGWRTCWSNDWPAWLWRYPNWSQTKRQLWQHWNGDTVPRHVSHHHISCRHQHVHRRHSRKLQSGLILALSSTLYHRFTTFLTCILAEQIMAKVGAVTVGIGPGRVRVLFVCTALKPLVHRVSKKHPLILLAISWGIVVRF